MQQVMWQHSQVQAMQVAGTTLLSAQLQVLMGTTSCGAISESVLILGVHGLHDCLHGMYHAE